ncbi:MAG: hypothetical protein CNE93_03585 [SAR116 cluster bacterium MED-G06]|nr:MAG: hypothetical protein CNE93_03585 [SAR116 cluster bacterium MED-G06]
MGLTHEAVGQPRSAPSVLKLETGPEMPYFWSVDGLLERSDPQAGWHAADMTTDPDGDVTKS